MLRINIVTIFPTFFDAPLSLSIPGRARKSGLATYSVIDLRDFTVDRHRTVDDAPFGGGRGMVMKAGPFFDAVDSVGRRGPVVLMSARGRRFGHDEAVKLSLESEITLLCGHYKDVDERVAQHLATDELSVGDFVVSGGEYAALAITDAVVRLLPGALGAHEAAASDSFYEDGLLGPPSYTRPAVYLGHGVPEVLLSGDHVRIEAWRREQAERLTRERRPDLWLEYLRKRGGD